MLGSSATKNTTRITLFLLLFNFFKNFFFSSFSPFRALFSFCSLFVLLLPVFFFVGHMAACPTGGGGCDFPVTIEDSAFNKTKV